MLFRGKLEARLNDKNHLFIPNPETTDATVVEATVFDAYAISELVRRNFESHTRYAGMDAHVKADYLRANSVGDILGTMKKPGTKTLLVKTTSGIAAMILVRETRAEEVELRFSELNGLRPNIGLGPALDIRRLHTGLGYEGRGFGTSLVRASAELARNQGLPLLISDATGQAQGFFEKQGFQGGVLGVGRQNGSEGTVFRCVKVIGE